jgi:hypothetical protein
VIYDSESRTEKFGHPGCNIRYHSHLKQNLRCSLGYPYPTARGKSPSCSGKVRVQFPPRADALLRSTAFEPTDVEKTEISSGNRVISAGVRRPGSEAEPSPTYSVNKAVTPPHLHASSRCGALSDTGIIVQ